MLKRDLEPGFYVEHLVEDLGDTLEEPASTITKKYAAPYAHFAAISKYILDKLDFLENNRTSDMKSPDAVED